MAISVFDLYTIGIGPSSSHTVGPMRAARRFVTRLAEKKFLMQTTRVKVELFGSLGLTGKGHHSDKAIILGLCGETPESADPDTMEQKITKIRDSKKIPLLEIRPVDWNEKEDLIFNRKEALPLHPNGMRFQAFDQNGAELLGKIYYSVGGGFIVGEKSSEDDKLVTDTTPVPFPFHSADELLKVCRDKKLKIHQVVFENEKSWRPESEIRERLLKIWQAMQDCVSRGCRNEGTLPGGLKVKRRAPEIYKALTQNPEAALKDPLSIMDWVNMYALAVNEENACGGRVVTAPTNGAAGIIPAVLHYFEKFNPQASDDKVVEFLLTAGGIGILYKENASISGAEVGCQGEVGVACSMAAAGLAAVMGGSNEQIENAAEIGMEHNLGLTCDPVGGLVQIPCIERNAMGSLKAINAARIALRGDGQHKISLDRVMKTMLETGRDMQDKYKETSRGGLASINIVEC